MIIQAYRYTNTLKHTCISILISLRNTSLLIYTFSKINRILIRILLRMRALMTTMNMYNMYIQTNINNDTQAHFDIDSQNSYAY